MDKVELTCGVCGETNLRNPKPEPQSAREAKAVYFICASCNAKNLRDGTIQGRKPSGISQEPAKKNDSDAGLLVWGIIGGFLAILVSAFGRVKSQPKQETPEPKPWEYPV